MVRKLIAVITCLAIVGCGAIDKKKDDADTKDDKGSGDVEFSGYVQKAFAIRVNNQDFKDSEDFYTRFIDELVKPSYPDIGAKDVKLEGKYGLDEFGSGSKVYMSSIASEGHLYEGRTDGQSKFTVKVQSTALDETFKARIVVRIGLEIAKEGADSQHYCYLLYGNKDNVAVSESAKPIIFDDFSTQLTTYKCDDVNEDKLVIPGATTDGAIAPGTSTPAKASVTDTKQVSIALDSVYEGGTNLTAATMLANGDIILARSAVRNKDTGKWCFPLIKVSGGTTATKECVHESTDDLSKVAQIGSIADASKVDLDADFGSHANARFVNMGTSVSVTNGLEVCDEALASCKPAPSNKCDLGYPKTVAWYAGAYVAANGVNSQGTSYCGAKAIHVMSSTMTYVKSYPVDIAQEEWDRSFLVSDSKSLYTVSLSADILSIKKLQLAEAATP